MEISFRKLLNKNCLSLIHFEVLNIDRKFLYVFCYENSSTIRFETSTDEQNQDSITKT